MYTTAPSKAVSNVKRLVLWSYGESAGGKVITAHQIPLLYSPIRLHLKPLERVLKISLKF